MEGEAPPTTSGGVSQGQRLALGDGGGGLEQLAAPFMG